jgi:tripartite-type tricarboxylate transporter receptor subunit TctC
VRCRSRPLRLISTSVTAGNIDVMCRIIAEKLSVRLGQPVVMDNKPGAATVATPFLSPS